MLDNLLAQLHEIHPLSDALTAYLRSILVTHQLPKKTLLLKKGEVCDQVYFIEKGMLHCYYEKNDAKITSWFMKENDVIISAKSFFLQQPSEETIITLEESIVHGISFEQLHDIYERFPEFNVIGRVLTTRYYIQSEERLYSLRKERAKDRYDHLVTSHPDILLTRTITTYCFVFRNIVGNTKPHKIEQIRIEKFDFYQIFEADRWHTFIKIKHMKKATLNYFLLFVIVAVSSCKKEDLRTNEEKNNQEFVEQSISYFKDHLSNDDLQHVNFNDYQLLINYPKTTIGIKFNLKNCNQQKFLILAKNKNNIQANWVDVSNLKFGTGELITKNLKGDTTIKTIFKDKIFVQKHILLSTSQSDFDLLASNHTNNADATLKEDTKTLPEIIITGQTNKNTINFYSLFYLLNYNDLFLDFYVTEDWMINVKGGGGDVEENLIQLDETFEKRPISLKERLECFFLIIDNSNTKYSISLFTDVPVNNFPLLPINGSSPGHVYLSISKSNGTSSSTLTFGFYPRNNTLKNTICDDGQREYNAKVSITNLDKVSFEKVLNLSLYLSEVKSYDLLSYNCTTYATEIFNTILTEECKIKPLFDGPTAVYSFLKNVKNDNSTSLAKYIQIGTKKSDLSSPNCK